MHTPFSQYSHAVSVEGAKKLIFCAGQVAGDEHGNILGPENFEAQGELVHGEFVNYAAIGIWNRPRQWYRQA
jgi:enamine deaminase RidA (YjgF/YER057c/UK114 family)